MLAFPFPVAYLTYCNPNYESGFKILCQNEKVFNTMNLNGAFNSLEGCFLMLTAVVFWSSLIIQPWKIHLQNIVFQYLLSGEMWRMTGEMCTFTFYSYYYF